MANFYVVTFGCQMNVNDSLWLSRALISKGHQEVGIDRIKEADFFILNTCSVRDKPEKNVHSTIGRLKKANPKMWGLVMGCVAQQLGKELFSRHTNLRLVLGTDTLYNAPEYIEEVIKREHNKKKKKNVFTEFSPTFPDRHHYLKKEEKNSPLAYVNIMQGCDNYCSYCIVPYTRGVPKSRSTESILEECRAWIEQGASEIQLLGQNVNAFGLDRLNDGSSFADLLRKIDKLEGVKRLRFMTPHPKDLADDTIKLFGELQSLCPRVHLPLQAGADRTLVRMNRPYTRQKYLDLIHKLRDVRSDICIGSDIIVGFPGETEEEFLDTLEIMEKAPIIFSYSFAYSDRPGTKASLMPDKIPQEIQAERLDRLQNFQHKLSADYLSSFIGQELELLIEGESKKAGTVQARDIYGNTVHIDSKKPVGAFVRGKIIKSFTYSLLAEEA